MPSKTLESGVSKASTLVAGGSSTRFIAEMGKSLIRIARGEGEDWEEVVAIGFLVVGALARETSPAQQSNPFPFQAALEQRVAQLDPADPVTDALATLADLLDCLHAWDGSETRSPQRLKHVLDSHLCWAIARAAAAGDS